MIWIWPVLRLVWESRGRKVETVAEDLTQNFGRGFSAATLSKLTTKTKEKAPEAVAAFILGQSVLPNSEETSEIVNRGLAAMESGAVTDPAALAAEFASKLPKMNPEVIAAAIVAKLQLDPHVIAQALVARFPTDELALKLADALAKLAGLSSGIGPMLDRLTLLITDRLPRVLKLREAKLARHLAQRLDRLSAKRIALAGAAGGVGGGAVLVLGVMGLAVLLLSGRLQVMAVAPEAPKAHVPTWLGSPRGLPQTPAVTSTAQQPIIIVASAAQDGTPIVFDLGTFLGAIASGEMGKRVPAEQFVPGRLLPGQKPPPCDPDLQEREISGGCWQETLGPPPCKKLFRLGDACFRPIAADPTKRVGLTREGGAPYNQPEGPGRPRRGSPPPVPHSQGMGSLVQPPHPAGPSERL